MNSAKKQIYAQFLAISILLLFLSTFCGPAWGETATQGPHFKTEINGKVTAGVPFNLKITALNEDGYPIKKFDSPVKITLESGEIFQYDNGAKKALPGEITLKNGVLEIEKAVIEKGGNNSILVKSETLEGKAPLYVMPGILTVLPPLLAIILALTLRQVVVSLFLGIWLGATFIYDFHPFTAFLRLLDTRLIKAIATTDHISIIVFSLFLGGMVAVISRSGGNQGIVEKIRKFVKNPRSGMIATWALGILIFFDDYANTLIVGNSMRPLTDKLKISREKLSFIVDATAAPVTNIAIISTWIGFELSMIGDSLSKIGLKMEPYMIFIQTIPYRYYPILLIIFIFMIAYMMRDFGPMLAAERRSYSTGQVLRPGARPISNIDMSEVEVGENVPTRWYNAVVPILSVILFTVVGLWYSGVTKIAADSGPQALANIKVYQILNNANSFHVLLWASFLGSLTAIGMVLSQKILTLEESLTAWTEGAKSIIPAIIILSLAWSIGDICSELNTGGYLSLLARGNVAPQLLPLIIFLISSAISFATGTSWGTMSIVMPIAVYVGYNVPPAEMAESMKNIILLGSISGVLAGATFGDHCSPISDTTIMSSMASACDHIDHVRTQMPYALLVATVGALFGVIPAGYGVNPFIGILLGTGAIYLILRFLGKNPTEATNEIKKDYIPEEIPKENPLPSEI